MKLKSRELRLENTNFCNAFCVTCPRDKMTREKTVMPLSLFYSLVDQGKELGAETISIFGYGEPLLDVSVPHRVAYCSHLGLETFVTTNGALLDVNVATSLLNAELTHIRFSVHGLYPKEFEAVHRGLKYVEVIRNIFNFIAMNNKKYDHACIVSVTAIPMHNESIRDFVRMWKPTVDYLEIWSPHNWCETKDYRKVERKKTTCGRPDSGPVQVQADGKVIPCCFLTDGEIVLGDTNKDSIKDIILGEPFEELRERHRTGDLTGLPCENCDQLNEYTAANSPLLYSNRDRAKRLNCTSSTKYSLGG